MAASTPSGAPSLATSRGRSWSTTPASWAEDKVHRRGLAQPGGRNLTHFSWDGVHFSAVIARWSPAGGGRPEDMACPGHLPPRPCPALPQLMLRGPCVDGRHKAGHDG